MELIGSVALLLHENVYCSAFLMPTDLQIGVNVTFEPRVSARAFGLVLATVRDYEHERLVHFADPTRWAVGSQECGHFAAVLVFTGGGGCQRINNDDVWSQCPERF